MIKYILLILVLLSCREKKVEQEKPHKLLFTIYGKENDTLSVGSGDTLVFFKEIPHDTVWLSAYEQKYEQELRAEQAYHCDTLVIHDTIYRTKVKWKTMYVNNGWEVDTSGIDVIILDTMLDQNDIVDTTKTETPSKPQ